MSLEFALLNIAVLGASALQAATGIGFGVIAGPILLVVLNDSSAIQVSIALNLLIAIIITPSLRHMVDRTILRNLVIGLLIGSPIGILIFLNIDIVLLKVTAGVGVLLTLCLLILRNRLRQPNSRAGRPEQISVGAIAGVMGACLAMPGPIPAAWMSSKGYDRQAIRATILAMFVFSYAIALTLQFATVGIDANTLKLSAALVPATVMGILLGNLLSKRITEKIFGWILTTILASTAFILFATIM